MIFILIPRVYKSDCQNVGGGEISNSLLISSISKIDKVILIPMLYSKSDNKFFNKEIKVINSKFKFINRFGYFFQKYFLFEKRVVSLANKYKPTRVICTRACISAGLAVKENIPCELEIIVRAYEDFNPENSYDRYKKITFLRKIDSLISSKRVKRAFIAANRIITNSHFMKTAIMKEFAIDKKCLVIYPEIDLNRKQCRFEDIKNVGFINRGKKKGSQVILELAQMNPSIKFLIYGDQLESSFSNIINMGYIEERSSIFDSIDVLLVPSLWYEPYGRVAAEAIWSGIPALVSKQGGLPEAAPTSKFWVADAKDIESWNRLLNSLNNNKDEINQSIHRAQNLLADYNQDYY